MDDSMTKFSLSDLPPEYRRQAEEQLAAPMKKTPAHKALDAKSRTNDGPVLIVLDGERPASWNQWYSGQHWTKRNAEAQRVHALVHAKLAGYHMFTAPVRITITAYFASRPLDASNITGKVYEDALKGRVIKDDSPKYVVSMTTVSRIDKKRPRVEILIQEDADYE